MSRGRTVRTPKKRAEFLEALSLSGNVTAACDSAGLARRSAYDWRDADPEFERDWDAALELGCDALEDEARRRAAEGVLEPVYYQGEEVGQIRKYSDTLLIFLLKGHRPERYRERHEHMGKDGGPIRLDVSNMTDEQIDDELRTYGFDPEQ